MVWMAGMATMATMATNSIRLSNQSSITGGTESDPKRANDLEYGTQSSIFQTMSYFLALNEPLMAYKA